MQNKQNMLICTITLCIYTSLFLLIILVENLQISMWSSLWILQLLLWLNKQTCKIHNSVDMLECLYNNNALSGSKRKQNTGLAKDAVNYTNFTVKSEEKFFKDKEMLNEEIPVLWDVW